MACIRKRRGKWIVDYRDGAGRRRWATCATRREADDVLATKVREARQQRLGLVVDSDLTVGQYAKQWLAVVATHVKPTTISVYRTMLDKHILPVLGGVKVQTLHRAQVKALLVSKLTEGRLTRSSVRIMHAVLRSLLAAAVDDGLLVVNPADRLGRALRLIPATKVRQKQIKAMTRDQLTAFLAAAWSLGPRHRDDLRYAPLFVFLARTGCRIGEALAVQWNDLDLAKRETRIERALSGRHQVGTPKSGHGRTVDLSRDLCTTLYRLHLSRKAETLRRGWPAVPPWVFLSRAGTRFKAEAVGAAMTRVLKRAGLPGYFTPHSLRHTFASILISEGVSPAYVQRQLGHSSIQVTVDVYGQALPASSKGVDLLDRPANGSRVVAADDFAPGNVQADQVEHQDASFSGS